MHFTFLPLKFIKTINHGKDTVPDVLLEVQDPCCFFRSFDLFKDQIAFDYRYVASFYILQATNTSLPQSQMLAKKVIASPFEAIPPFVVWKGQRAEEQDRNDIQSRKDKSKSKRKKSGKGQTNKITRYTRARAKHRKPPASDMADPDLDEGVLEDIEDPEPEADDHAREDHDNDDSFEENNADTNDLAISAVRDNVYLDDQDDLSDAAGFTSESEAELFWSESEPEGNPDDDDDDNGPDHPPGHDQHSDKNSESCPVAAADAGNGIGDGGADAEPSGTDAVDQPMQEPSRTPRAPVIDRNMNPDQIDVPGGNLRFYTKKQEIVAHCTEHSEDCRKARTVKPSSAPSRSGQGRPIGLLVAWLNDPDSHACAQGISAAHTRTSVPRYQDRLTAREAFNQIPGSSIFAQHERPRRANEDEEPMSIP